MANITKTDPVDNIGSVLANICASSPSRMINGIFRELIDFIATSDDNIALFEFSFHIRVARLNPQRSGRVELFRCSMRGYFPPQDRKEKEG